MSRPRGVSLALERGEVVALEGPSGSGKTTFLSILGCILTPTSGEVVVEGQKPSIARKPRKLPEIRKRSIGFVFQQFNLFPALTALENVEYALNIKGGRRPSATRRRRSASSSASGSARRTRFLPRDLSGGQKQRVAIARALAGRAAPILLADEPTANLDSQVGSADPRAVPRRSRGADGRALLIVTHDPKVRAVADRVVRIRDGKIAA